ncbi:MAG: hypothetical protein C5B47_04670, partial [Verrucomicrobia bacterium]
ATIRPVPFEELARGTAEENHTSGGNAAPVLNRAPPLSVGKLERRGLVLVLPEDVLKTNAPSDFQDAVHALLQKHPETEVYAMSKGRKGNVRHWKFHTDLEEGDWKGKWSPLQTVLTGEYAKIELLGHGDPRNAQMGLMSYSDVAKELAKLMGRVSEIEHLSILACCTPLEFGVTLQSQLAAGSQIHSAGCLVKEITLSEVPISIGIDQPGKRLYLAGDHVLKWQLALLPTGELQVIRYQPAPNQILDSIHEPSSYAGPFLYAEQQRKQFEAQRKVEFALKAFHAVVHDVEQKAAQLSPQSGRNVALPDQMTETNGRFLVPAVNFSDGTVQAVPISPEQAASLKSAQEILANGYEYLKPHLAVQEGGRLEVQEGAGQPSTLNGAFFAMALLRALRQQEGASAAAKLSFYWNLAGMAAATAGDGVEIGKIVNQLLAAGGAVERSLQVLGNVFQVANGLFTAGALGLDFYELARTSDPAKRLGIEIGMAFNGAALALQAGSAMVSWLTPAAAGTAAAGFGSLAVPLAGLGFGFSALGTQIEQNNQRVHALLDYFVKAKKAYLNGGMEKKHGILIPRYPAIITKLDFMAGKITFGSQRVARSQSQGWYAPNLIYNFEDKDWERFGLREAFQIESEAPLDTAPRWVLVPSVPNTRIDYSYLNTAPSLTSEEENVAEILRKNGSFVAWNSNKSLGAGCTGSRGFTSDPLTVDLILDSTPRGLLFPAEVDAKVNYRIVGSGGSYTLSNLPFGSNLRMEDRPGTRSSYLLKISDAPLLSNASITLDSGFLIVKNQQNQVIRIHIANLSPHSKINVEGTVAQWEVDIPRHVRLSALDLRRDSSLDAEACLRKIANQEKAKAVVLLIQGELPLAPKKEARAEEWLLYQHQLQMAERLSIHTAYDSTTHQIIAPAADYPTPQTVLNDSNQILGPWISSKLVALTEKKAVFFNQRTQVLWFTQRTTNQVMASYWLPFANSESRIEHFAENESSFRLIVPLPCKRELSFTYALHEGELLLEAIENLSHEELNRLDPRRLDPRSRKHPPLPEFISQSGIAQWIYGALPQTADSFQKVKVAEWLKIQGTDARGYPQRLLVNFEKKRVIPIHLLLNTISIQQPWGETTLINFEYLKQSSGDAVDLAASDFRVITSRKMPDPPGGWNIFLQFPNSAKICKIPAVPTPSGALTFLLSANGKIPIENPLDQATLEALAHGKRGRLIAYAASLYFVTEDGELLFITPEGSQMPIKFSERPAQLATPPQTQQGSQSLEASGEGYLAQ